MEVKLEDKTLDQLLEKGSELVEELVKSLNKEDLKKFEEYIDILIEVKKRLRED